MLLSRIEKRTQPIIIPATDETALAEGIRKCVIYRTFEPATGEINYYHGGGLYSSDNKRLTLWLDYLRPGKYTEFNAEEFIYLKFDGIALDILCKNMMWISSVVTSKTDLPDCSFRYLKFDDKRVLSVRDGVAVVDLPMVNISVPEINRSTVFRLSEPDVINCRHPLTIAYTRKDDGIYIGCWDTVEGCFVGSLKKYWADLLDIGL